MGHAADGTAIASTSCPSFARDFAMHATVENLRAHTPRTPHTPVKEPPEPDDPGGPIEPDDGETEGTVEMPEKPRTPGKKRLSRRAR